MFFLDEAEGSFLRAFLGGTAGAVESAFALLFLGLLDSADVLAIAWDTKKKTKKNNNHIYIVNHKPQHARCTCIFEDRIMDLRRLCLPVREALSGKKCLWCTHFLVILPEVLTT